jgi:Haem-NO-binding
LILLLFLLCSRRLHPYLIAVFLIFCGTPHDFEVQETLVLGYPLKTVLNAIETRYGHETVLQLFAEAGVPADRVYRLNEPYPDSEALRLSAAAFRRISVEEMGEYFFKDTIERFPTWYAMCKTSREFLEMQPEIHNTFAHGLQRPEERAAVRDKFHLEKLADELVVHYRSPNHLCDMYKAVARHVFKHYGDNATIAEPRCMKRGDGECELRIRWT